MTDEEALETARLILAKEAILVPITGTTWKSVIDLCRWVIEASGRLPKPKQTRNEYMRDYMRLRRAKEKLSKELT